MSSEFRGLNSGEAGLKCGKHVTCFKRRENKPFVKAGKLVACSKRRENKPFVKAGKLVPCFKTKKAGKETIRNGGKTYLSLRREHLLLGLKDGENHS